MLIRLIVIFLICCTACRSGIIPCPEVKGLRLKKSNYSRRSRPPEKTTFSLRQDDTEMTVSSDAKTLKPMARSTNKSRYVKYTMQHIDVEEMDCPKPGSRKTMPKAVKENIRRNKKKIQHYREISADTLVFVPAQQSFH